MQAAVLAGELANFLLAVRDEDGTTLLENPEDFSRATRTAAVVNVNRPFFRYFLTQANARQFHIDDVVWEPPRSCVTQFEESKGTAGGPAGLEACFATVRADPSGRYIYFALRYPFDGLTRHQRGGDTTMSDSVRLSLAGDRVLDARLVFETPAVALSRFPSQLWRFSRIHEVTAYGADGEHIRAISAQAYEGVAGDGRALAKIVTVLGRLDAASIIDMSPTDPWPTAKAKQIKIGIELSRGDEAVMAHRSLRLPAGTLGTAATSIEHAYLTQVLSKSTLVVRRTGARAGELWTSASLPSSTLSREESWLQRLSDRWATLLVEFTDKSKTAPLRVSQILGGQTGVEATLQAEPTRLPDIATRAFLFLSCALSLVLVLGVIWLTAIVRLRLIAIASYRMTTAPSIGASLKTYAKRQDEIGRLARILDLLITKGRFRDLQMIFRRSNEVRTAGEQVKVRQAILEAIGHEIRSPLQSIIARTADDSGIKSDLARMSRAINTLYDATSVEAGLKSGRVVLEKLDIASHLRAYAENLSATGSHVKYSGLESGVVALFDQINFEQVLQHVVENALRYRVAGTPIEISLLPGDISVQVDIFNQGPQIDVDRLEKIFDLGESTGDTPSSRGLGLFVARTYMAGMQGAISAVNLAGGVCLRLELPVASWSGGVPRPWLREFRTRTLHTPAAGEQSGGRGG